LQNASVAPTIASFDTALSETGEHRPTSASAIVQECAAGADSGGDLRRGVVVGEHAPLNRDISLRGGSRRRFGGDNCAVFDAGALRRNPSERIIDGQVPETTPLKRERESPPQRALLSNVPGRRREACR